MRGRAGKEWKLEMLTVLLGMLERYDGWLVLEGDGIGSLPSGDGSSAHTNAYNHVHLIQIYTFKKVS